MKDYDMLSDSEIAREIGHVGIKCADSNEREELQ